MVAGQVKKIKTSGNKKESEDGDYSHHSYQSSAKFQKQS